MENIIDYLRLSLTDRCNLNCMYCTPFNKKQFLSREEVLSYEEIVMAVDLFVKAGVRKLRLTGGEPLIKKDIIILVKMLKEIKGLEEISMTTNGVFLKDTAHQLKEAGLDRVNVSIDTLKKEKFRLITGFDYFDRVWEGITKALEAGLNPVKLNVILMKEINDDEIINFARLTVDYPLSVRFIEFFPTNKRSVKFVNSLIKSEDVKRKISSSSAGLEEISDVIGNGPARYYKIKDSKGALGFISGSSSNFCNGCNRIRMDCAGRISPCLFSGYTHDIRPLLTDSCDEAGRIKFIKQIFKIKPDYRKDISINHKLEMSSIGG